MTRSHNGVAVRKIIVLGIKNPTMCPIKSTTIPE
jgi:hypothetical protein